jgi:hypothetical protein
MQVDHACHNRACVNPDHLRLASPKQNQENRRGAASSNRSSGVRGVTYGRGKWIASVQHNGKRYNCGGFSSVEEAEAAVVAKRLELFTHNIVDREAARLVEWPHVPVNTPTKPQEEPPCIPTKSPSTPSPTASPAA